MTATDEGPPIVTAENKPRIEEMASTLRFIAVNDHQAERFRAAFNAQREIKALIATGVADPIHVLGKISGFTGRNNFTLKISKLWATGDETPSA